MVNNSQRTLATPDPITPDGTSFGVTYGNLSVTNVTYAPKTAKFGDTINLTAVTQGGTGNFSYQWYIMTASNFSKVKTNGIRHTGTSKTLAAKLNMTNETFIVYVTDKGAQQPYPVAYGYRTLSPLAANSSSPNNLNPPTILPSPVKMDLGQHITLVANEILVPKSCTLLWQWYRNGTAISNSTSGTLLVTPSFVSNAVYTVSAKCNVAHANATLSLPDNLTVYPRLGAPSISPNSPTISRGQKINLTAAISGGTGVDFLYRWSNVTLNTFVLASTSNTVRISPNVTTAYKVNVADMGTTSGALPVENATSPPDTVTIVTTWGCASPDVPPGIVAYYPIDITPQGLVDSQDVQVPIDFRSAANSTLTPPNLRNIEFFYCNGNIAPSWLESYSASNLSQYSGYSNDAKFWVGIRNISAPTQGSPLPAGSRTIYMGFTYRYTSLFNGNMVGIAGELHCPVGCVQNASSEYDNGANVFTLYQFLGSSAKVNASANGWYVLGDQRCYRLPIDCVSQSPDSMSFTLQNYFGTGMGTGIRRAIHPTTSLTMDTFGGLDGAIDEVYHCFISFPYNQQVCDYILWYYGQQAIYQAYFGNVIGAQVAYISDIQSGPSCNPPAACVMTSVDGTAGVNDITTKAVYTLSMSGDLSTRLYAATGARNYMNIGTDAFSSNSGAVTNVSILTGQVTNNANGGGGYTAYAYWTRLRYTPATSHAFGTLVVVANTICPVPSLPAGARAWACIPIFENRSYGLPVGFVQNFTFDAGASNALLDCNLDNVLFRYANGTAVQSWLEGNYLGEGQTGASGCLSTSNTIMYQLRMGAPLQRDNATYVYLVIINKGANSFGAMTGAAPQLFCAGGACPATHYAQYDNGASVFQFYDNFIGGVLGNNWAAQHPGSQLVDNGLLQSSGFLNSTVGINASNTIVDMDEGLGQNSGMSLGWLLDPAGGGCCASTEEMTASSNSTYARYALINQLGGFGHTSATNTLPPISINGTLHTYLASINGNGNTYGRIDYGPQYSPPTQVCGNYYCMDTFPSLGAMPLSISMGNGIVQWVMARPNTPDGIFPNATAGLLHQV